MFRFANRRFGVSTGHRMMIRARRGRSGSSSIRPRRIPRLAQALVGLLILAACSTTPETAA
ncbi:MAG: hypothetical protein R3335_08845, partial [Anaerolineales bacterium]|nr:hypothetical protein [Anaerolineales bacterium]